MPGIGLSQFFNIRGASLPGLRNCLLILYDWDGRPAVRQRAGILSFFNIRLMTPELKQALFSWVNADLLPMDYSIERLLELVGDWFREQKIEPPGTARLSRVLRSELNSFDTSMLYLVGKFNEFSTMRGNTKRAAACVWRKVAISAGLLQIAYRVLFSFEKSLD